MKGSVFNIQKFSIHDGPGIRTTVFFKGCNLKCKWCANPESQSSVQQLILDTKKCVKCGRCIEVCTQGARSISSESEYPVVDEEKCTRCLACRQACPAGAVSAEGSEMTVEEIVSEVLKDKPFYDTSGGGVTLSGGEVLLQTEFAVSLCRRLHEEGISVGIETAAHVPAEVFADFIKEADFVYIDFKHYDSEKHRQGTGAGNEQIIENIKTLSQGDKPFTVRIPVIPGFNDSKEEAQGFGEALKSLGVHQVELLPFHQMGEQKYANMNRDYSFQGLPGLHREDVEPLGEILKKYVENVLIGG